MTFRLTAGLALALFLTLIAPATAQRRPGLGPSEVGVITLTTEDVPYSVTLPGRAVAWQSADIRPRVSGVVAEILYDEGQPIRAGDAMFRIEDDNYRAALMSAEAGVRQSEAAIATAEAALKRARSLVGVGSTQATLEAAELSLAQAQAGLSAAQAQQQIAQLDLDRTVMRSPIDGVPDVPAVTIGALVTANQADPLTVVRRIDPIYVDVAQSSASILRTRDRIRASELQPGEELGVRLTLEDGHIHDGMGRMVSRGNAVSATTGTAIFRFAFDNPEALILPGQFLRVQVTLGTTRAVLVPQRATSRAADGSLTAFTVRDGRAKQIKLTEAGVARNAWVVIDGVAEGDQIIVDGLQNLRDGAEVKPVPVQISDDGVVIDDTDDAVSGAVTDDGALTDAPADTAATADGAANPDDADTRAGLRESETSRPAARVGG